MHNSLHELLEDQTNAAALRETDEGLMDPVSGIMEALEESADLEDYEQPTDSGIDHLQFFNQDHLDGLDDETLANFHPDNTEALNKEVSGTAGSTSTKSAMVIVEELLAPVDAKPLAEEAGEDDNTDDDSISLSDLQFEDDEDEEFEI